MLVDERGVLAAIAEERLNRQKHCAGFPGLAVAEVLRIAGASLEDVTDIAVARDPWANLAWKAAFVARHPRSGLSKARSRLGVHREVMSTGRRLATALGVPEGRVKARLHHVEHHLAHATSAFYWSPFEEAAGFTHDGAEDFATTLWARCRGTSIEVIRRSHWPHSPGVFYTALTQFIGFEKYGEEYKVMGLSAYGQNRFSRLMREMIGYHPQLGLRLDLSFYCHHQQSQGLEVVEDGEVKIPRLWGERLERELGPARRSGEPLAEREKDVAASMQVRFEEVFLDQVAAVTRRTGLRDVVMAGGSALNSVANGRMLTEGYADRAYFHRESLGTGRNWTPRCN